MASTDFNQFGLHEVLIRGVKAAGFESPRPIQLDTIPAGTTAILSFRHRLNVEKDYDFGVIEVLDLSQNGRRRWLCNQSGRRLFIA